MFKFGFSSDACEDETRGVQGADNCKKKWDDCKELVPNEGKLENILSNTQLQTVNLGDVQIKLVSSNYILEVLRTEECAKEVSVLKAEQNHSDLLPAVYEGGFKIWECTYDILNYLNDNKVDFQKKRVLDLGCGAGMVGIYTLMRGATCFFQDYNLDVLEYITVPNVFLNSKKSISRCKFYSGDWQSFSSFLGNNTNGDDKFDFIITSETIYNTENYYKLHSVFEALLKKNGTIFLAAKSFYFGVGGGISLFEDFIDERQVFKYSSCWKCKEGVKREILKIRFNDPKTSYDP